MEEVLIQVADRTTTQILYDRGLFDIYDNVAELLKVLLFTKRRLDLEKVNDVDIQ